MKKWVVGILSLGLLLSLFPFALGWYLKNHYETSLTALSDSTNLPIRLVSFQRGWLHSSATLITSLPFTDQPLSDGKQSEKILELRQRIYHGPLIFKKYAITFAPAVIETYYQDTPLASTTITWLGHAKTDLRIPSLIVAGHSPFPLYAVLGAYGKMDWNIVTHSLDGIFKLHQLVAKIDQPRIIDNGVGQFHLDQTKGGLWIGDKSFHFGTIKWQKDDNQFVINDLNYASTSQIANHHLTLKVAARINDVAINQQFYGAQQIVLAFKDLNQTAAERLHQQFPLTRLHLLTPVDFAQAQQQLAALIQQGGEFAIQTLNFNTTWGPVAAQASAIYQAPGTSNPNHYQIQATMPTQLVTTLLSEFYRLKLRTNDEQFLQKEVEQNVTTWQKEGLLHVVGTEVQINYQGQK